MSKLSLPRFRSVEQSFFLRATAQQAREHFISNSRPLPLAIVRGDQFQNSLASGPGLRHVNAVGQRESEGQKVWGFPNISGSISKKGPGWVFKIQELLVSHY
jgi:hypothetical protein